MLNSGSVCEEVEWNSDTQLRYETLCKAAMFKLLVLFSNFMKRRILFTCKWQFPKRAEGNEMHIATSCP